MEQRASISHFFYKARTMPGKKTRVVAIIVVSGYLETTFTTAELVCCKVHSMATASSLGVDYKRDLG
jgi:hypothetical protein